MFDRSRPCRIIKSGHVLEIFFYDKLPTGKQKDKDEEILNMLGRPIQIDFPEFVYDEFIENDLGKVLKWFDKEFLPKEWKVKVTDKNREMEYRRTANHRSREKIRRLALSNFHEHDTFMTLTFKENIQDLDFANDELKKFFKRFRYKYGEEIPYLGVIEFQKRGAIHYHCLVGIDFGINYTDTEERQAKEREIGEVWKNGHVDLQDIRDVDNIGAYIVKYLTKDLGDDRLSGRKHYVLSKGLKHPEIIKDTTVYLDSLEGRFPWYSNNFENEFCGSVQYLEFNTKRW